MLDLSDFIAERGGDPDKLRENQRRRFAPVDIIDDIVQKYENHRQGKRPNCTSNYVVD